jgi:hypothetical protein
VRRKGGTKFHLGERAAGLAWHHPASNVEPSRAQQSPARASGPAEPPAAPDPQHSAVHRAALRRARCPPVLLLLHARYLADAIMPRPMRPESMLYNHHHVREDRSLHVTVLCCHTACRRHSAATATTAALAEAGLRIIVGFALSSQQGYRVAPQSPWLLWPQQATTRCQRPPPPTTIMLRLAFLLFPIMHPRQNMLPTCCTEYGSANRMDVTHSPDSRRLSGLLRLRGCKNRVEWPRTLPSHCRR